MHCHTVKYYVVMQGPLRESSKIIKNGTDRYLRLM